MNYKLILSLTLVISTGCMNDKNLGYGHIKNNSETNQLQLVIK